jgi:hypothetical protein
MVGMETELKITNIFDLVDGNGKSRAPDSVAYFKAIEMAKRTCVPFSILLIKKVEDQNN